MIDTHTHLYLEQFKDDIDDVISRAKNVGVHRFYLPSISSKYNKSMRDLEKKFPDDISCMIGLHPCYVDDCLPSAHPGATAPINIDDMQRVSKNIHQTIYITSLGTIVFSLEILYLIFPKI